MSDKNFLTRIADKISKNKTAALGVAAAGAITANQILDTQNAPTADISMQEYVTEHGYTKDEIANFLEEARTENASDQAKNIARLHENIKGSHNHALVELMTGDRTRDLDAKEKLIVVNEFEERLNDLYSEDRPNNYFARSSSAHNQARNLQEEFKEVAATGEVPEFSASHGNTKIEDVGNYAEFLSIVEDARQNVHLVEHYKEHYSEQVELDKQQFAQNAIEKNYAVEHEIDEVSYSMEM